MMSPTSRPNRIAIDIGGVISKYQKGGHALLSDWFQTQDAEVPRAMLSIREIVRRFGADNVFIISKAGLKMAQLTKTWLLETMAIDAVTGFNPKNIHFCRKISGSEGKGKIAQKLGITHMIDDQDEALRTTYQTINDSGDPFPPYGQTFRFALVQEMTHLLRVKNGNKKIAHRKSFRLAHGMMCYRSSTFPTSKTPRRHRAHRPLSDQHQNKILRGING